MKDKLERRILTSILSIFFIASIVNLVPSCDRLDSGTIIEKYIIPEHYESSTQLIPMPDGTTLILPTSDYVPDRFYIRVEGISKKGRKMTRGIQVNQDDFYSYRVGEKINLN